MYIKIESNAKNHAGSLLVVTKLQFWINSSILWIHHYAVCFKHHVVTTSKTRGYPTNGKDGIKVKNMRIEKIKPDSWADNNTDLSNYINWRIIKINDVDVEDASSFGKVQN